MKKQQNDSTRAWVLQVALSVALVSISAILVASTFKATPATRGLSAIIKPGAAGDKDPMIAGPASDRRLFPADAPFTFSDTGSLATARDSHFQATQWATSTPHLASTLCCPPHR
jgi:hypothetical protein